MPFDTFLFKGINQFAGKWDCLDKLGIFFAQYFEYFLIFFLFLFLILDFKKYWLMLVQSLISVILARFFIVEIIRLIFSRPRPFMENQVNLLLEGPKTFSFPSGHAAFYFAIAAIVYFYNKKAGILFFISAFFISFARVFSGLHWPSDILAGFLVGFFSSWFIFHLFQKFFLIEKKKQLQ